MILRDIIHIIESAVPLKWQEAWDNSGLQVGDRNADIQQALLTTDVTESVVAEAIATHCQLIISHHPLIFHGLKHLTGESSQERCVIEALQHGIAIYSAHTSIDSWLAGVSGEMAARLGITNCRILVPQPGETEVGLGVIGELPQAEDTLSFIARVKEIFGAPMIRYTLGKNQVRTIALCGGAGAEFVEQALQQGADAYISADFKYHEMQAVAEDIVVIDMDHWVSEHFTRAVFARLLDGQVATRIAASDRSPIHIM